MHRVRCRVAGLGGDLAPLDQLHELRASRIGLRVQNVNSRRPRARHDEIPTLYVRVRRVRTEVRAARVPAEVVQLVVAGRQIRLTDEAAVRPRTWVDVDDANGVALT